MLYGPNVNPSRNLFRKDATALLARAAKSAHKPPRRCKMFALNLKTCIQMLTLVGTLVVPMAASAWRVELNFNAGKIGDKAETPVGGMGFNDAAGNTYYSSAYSFEGGKSAEMNITQGCTCFGTWGGVILHPTKLVKGNEIWFRVRTLMPQGFNWDSYGEGGHLKFLRVHTQTAAGANEGYDDWYINPKGTTENVSHKFIFEGEQQWDYFAPKSEMPVLGVWETYEMYLKLDDVPVSAGGQARVRVWKNGKLLKDITNRKTLKTPTSVSDRTHLFTYWNGSAPQTQKMYVDDIVLTSDKPSALDSQGNPYVGAAVVNPAPSAPALIVQ
jgi:hypothetical protein